MDQGAPQQHVVTDLQKKKRGERVRRSRKKGLRPVERAVKMTLIKIGVHIAKLREQANGGVHGQNMPVQDIPYGPAHFLKGTQTPVIRLYFKQYIISTAAAAYTTVMSVTAGTWLNFSDLANVFDEYRPLRGELKYLCVSQFTMTIASVGNNTMGGAVLDYANNTALGSFDDLESHDTKCFFSLCAFPGAVIHPGKPVGVWPIRLEPLPDEDWLSTSTTSTAFCYWKPYFSSAATLGSSFTAGYLLGWMDVQFRGMSV